MDARRFTGRQIATIVVAVCIAATLLPVGVYAATGAIMNIADAENANDIARVDSGRLRVGDGSGAVTVDGSTVRLLDVSRSTLPTGGTVRTYEMNTQPYGIIRLHARNDGSAGSFVVTITSLDSAGNSRIGLSEFTLNPGGVRNELHEVPGLRVRVTVAPLLSGGNITVFSLLVFGRTP